jgi:prepilin-type N-terminal cleavage/methylation domain-containing protein
VKNIFPTATRRQSFTLIELLVAMGVFSVLMLALIGFFDSAQKVWVESSRKNEAYENARIAMDLLTRHIQSIYYEDQKTPFYCETVNYPGQTVEDSGRIAFIGKSALVDNSCNSQYAKIQFSVYTDTDANNTPWFAVSVTGDNHGPVDQISKSFYYDYVSKYNFLYPPPPAITMEKFITDGIFTSKSTNAAEGNSLLYGGNGNDPFQKISPYMVSLKFICLDRNLTQMTCTDGSMPYAVKVDMAFLDRVSFKQFSAMANGTEKNDFKERYKRSMSKIILVGNRGQYK